MVAVQSARASSMISFFALGVALATPVAAQDGNAPPQADKAADGNIIIVTAQKREEALQDVPIAISAFSAEMLDNYKIEGGSELLRAVPNVNFSKSNFSGYNFSIRGIGTKAVSASTDPAVAVSFNNSPLIRNRLFESEFFDMQRVEVLRGPQGTLYGRNATGGVVNLIPALPDIGSFGLDAKVEVGNYKAMRTSGMINVPLGDTLAVRLAGALTSRDGFDYNSFTDRRVNGRELWSTRASIAWEPSDRFRANAIWQHFQEDDDRSRTGKQLCAPDPGPATIGGARVPDGTQAGPFGGIELDLRSRMSQGCLPVSLYDDRSYGAPNAAGYAPIVAGATFLYMGLPPGEFSSIPGLIVGNPFGAVEQSRDLHTIATSIDPVFRAKNDLFQGNLEFDISDGLTLVSQTAYARDRYYSTQDYNRYVSAPVFRDTSGLVDGTPGYPDIVIEIPGMDPIIIPGQPDPNPIDQSHAAPGGVFCDPQLGCSDRMISMDLSRSRNRQWSQEFRLQSDFDGPLNFNLGVNYLDFKSQDDYFVFNNVYTYFAYNRYNRLADGTPGSEFRYRDCPVDVTDRDCVYIDPNPIGALDEQGHNYFRSRNNVRTKSWAIFGEGYWNVSDTVKVTIGARFTRDDKSAVLYPSQLLLGGGGIFNTTGGSISGGYHANEPIKQRWSKPTGRIVVDWKPDLSFTDDTLIYASASHGYKGGGANPARPAISGDNVQFTSIATTFKPEYVNAFEIGTKNSFDGGRLTLNATGFYYDYEGYQVSQIVDRIALNENFDAASWGLELEAAWRPSRAFRIDANFGYLKTRLKDGAQSIDVMNRTQGNDDWVLVRPWLQVPSNCVAPAAYVEHILETAADSGTAGSALYALCGQSKNFGSFDPADPVGFLPGIFGITYDPFAPYDPTKVGAIVPYDPANPNAWRSQVSGAPNRGRGFFADLSGNELPNAPRVTVNVGAQYSFFFGDWDLTLRGDYYRQSKSYARVYNTSYDRLKGWDNVNLAVTLARPDSGLTFQLYVKNLFNDAPITDFFTNSDDSMLSTNVFTLDPRIIGFSATKRF